MGIFGTKIGKRLPIYLSNNIGNIGNISISSVRVKKIILDNISEPELFNNNGEWNSIGAIFYESVNSPVPPNSNNYLTNIAYPLFSNIKNYPLENEIVFLLSLASTNSQIFTSNRINYYISPINMWNSIHHNALPETVWQSLFPDSQKKDYISTSTGNIRRVTDGSTEIPLGNTFVEKTDIKSLLPYEGDVIYEGRWGNSIRFSSTIKEKNKPFGLNNWSKGGISKTGDPIIIIRNGQFNDGKDPWVPITEDINKDKSSIYLTSTQEIDIPLSYNLSQAEFSPNYPSSPQIILNSGRLIFNSTSESIGLTSKKQILLGAQDKIYLESKTTSLISKKIYLGSEDATEPLLLGNKTITLFQQILVSLQSLANVLPTVGTSESTIPGTPNIKVTTAAANLAATLGELIPQLESLKSKQNYTL